MSRQEVLKRFCVLVNKVSKQLDPGFSLPRDCFCGEGCIRDDLGFHVDKVFIEFIEEVVEKALK